MLVPLCLFVAVATGQDPPRDAGLDALVTLDSRHYFDPPQTAEAWRARRDAVRRQVLVAAGLWPEPPRCALEPVIHGAIEREGYVVQRVLFRGFPGLYVTGNLYRPTGGEGPFAGVLCPHGHWAQGRFTVTSEEDARASIERGGEVHLANARHPLQARCAQLARMGCVVFHYDMIGYADSKQLDHRNGFGDVEAELWGMSHFALQTLTSIRALDFLESLPDVDPERLAATGASGGGTQTFILGAVDDRPAALFPAVMVSNAMQGGCVCENASHLRVGTGNVEIAALAAPCPLGLVGANDWTVKIEEDGLPQLRAVYSLLDAPDAVAGWCHPEFPHNYNRVSRTYMYEWFAEHLDLDVERPIVEPELVPIDPQELSVFDDGHALPDDATDLAGVRAAWLDFAAKDTEHFASLARHDPSEYRRIVGGALTSMTRASLPDREEAVRGGVEPVAGPCIVHVASETVEGTTDALELLAYLGEFPGLCKRVAPLLPGESGLPVDSGRHGTYVGYTWGYNDTLFAHRVQDILTAIATARAQGDEPVALVGLGESAPWVVAAAALAGDAVSHVVVEGGWDFDRIESIADPDLLPRALRYGGVAGFAALLAPRPLLWIGEDGPPAVVSGAYEGRGAEAAVSTLPSADLPAVAAWLVRGK